MNDSNKRLFRLKLNGDLCELTRVLPEGRLQLRRCYERVRPGDLTGELIVSRSEVAPADPISPESLREVIDLARVAFQRGETRTPEVGDLVFDPSVRSDPDSIGWLVARGEAATDDDGTGETREVWDIWPLSGATGENGRPQRWENAEFHALPEAVVRRVEKLQGGGS